MNQSDQQTTDGPQLSRIIAGVWKWGAWGWQLNTQQQLRLIEKSIEYGVTTFDHADIYGDYTNEADFGKALRLKPSLRQQMQLITKCGICMQSPNRPSHRIKSYDTSAAHILQSVDNSLINLHTDYLDVLLIHRPSPLMNPDVIADCINQLQTNGKILHFGVSNFTSSQFAMLHSRIPLITNQIQASVIHLDPFTDGTLDQCIQHCIRPMAWSPLGSGVVFSSQPNEQVSRIRKVTKVLQQKYNASLDQILLAWLLRHPASIIPVLGTARAERIKAAAEATSIELSKMEWFELWQASTGQEVP